MSARAARRQQGVTLVQVLVGSAIGLSLVAAVGSYFVNASRSSRADINVARMLDELSYGAAQLAVDLEMAGFWAQVHDPATIAKDASLAVVGDCGGGTWYQDLRALEVLDNAGAAAAAAAFPCLTAAEVAPGSDVLAIKRVLGRVAGTDTATAALRDGTLYLRTHDRFGVLYRRGAGNPAVTAPYREWEYAPALYYVQPYTASADESPRVPALCRKVLRVSNGAPAFRGECVAAGIEGLQVEIGVDSDEDGGANFFTATPSAGDLARASTARVYLLVRSPQADPNYVNRKTYQIGNGAPYTPAGADAHYYRKTLSTEVALRNPRALQGVAVQ